MEVKYLLKIVYAPCIESVGGQGPQLEEWLDLSYDNFYITFTSPTLTPKSWDQLKKMKWDKLAVCTPCCEDVLSKRKNMARFLEESKGQLAVLDLFGGVGAFSRGMTEGSGQCLKVTHAIEIGPSAAKTFTYVFPWLFYHVQNFNLFFMPGETRPIRLFIISVRMKCFAMLSSSMKGIQSRFQSRKAMTKHLYSRLQNRAKLT